MSLLEFADSCSLTGDPPGFVYGLNMRSEPAAGQTGTFWDAVRDFDFVMCFNILFCSISCECSSVRLTVFRIRLKSFNGHLSFVRFVAVASLRVRVGERRMGNG